MVSDDDWLLSTRKLAGGTSRRGGEDVESSCVAKLALGCAQGTKVGLGDDDDATQLGGSSDAAARAERMAKKLNRKHDEESTPAPMF